MKKWLLTGVVLIVVGLGGLLLTGISNEEKTFAEEKIIDSKGVDEVEIKVDIGSVNIIESDREDIFVQYEGNAPLDRFQFAAERNGDQVKVTAYDKINMFSSLFRTSILTFKKSGH